MWGIQLLEIGGRMLVGRIKPVTFSHTPPGAVSNFVYLALCVSMLAIILISNTQKAAQQY
jgi:predicted tellurium resistance membrane protein TerC